MMLRMLSVIRLRDFEHQMKKLTLFIFRKFPTEKTEKEGLFSQFRATEKVETENLTFFIFGLR